MKLLSFATAMVLSIAALSGQTPAGEAFEVASIRPGDSQAGGGTIRVQPGGRFVGENITVRSLITTAYGVPAIRILGLPAWAAETRYQIDARATPREQLTYDEARPMLRTLLRQRFQLTARQEMRELPVYLLTLARPDGALGPRLRRNDVDCLDADARNRARAAAPPGVAVCQGIRFATGRMVGGPMPIDSLAGSLEGSSGRPVLNRTGLEGNYDVDLEWAATPDAVDAVSIFTALQEQLGLKLESSRAPLDVLVIERVERPSEN